MSDQKEPEPQNKSVNVEDLGQKPERRSFRIKARSSSDVRNENRNAEDDAESVEIDNYIANESSYNSPPPTPPKSASFRPLRTCSIDKSIRPKRKNACEIPTTYEELKKKTESGEIPETVFYRATSNSMYIPSITAEMIEDNGTNLTVTTSSQDYFKYVRVRQRTKSDHATPEKVIAIIEAVRKKPIIWDQRLACHHNVGLTRRAWQQLDNELGVDEEYPLARRKQIWKSKKDYFSFAVTSAHETKWTFSDAMEFYRPMVKFRSNVCLRPTIPTSSTEDENLFEKIVLLDKKLICGPGDKLNVMTFLLKSLFEVGTANGEMMAEHGLKIVEIFRKNARKIEKKVKFSQKRAALTVAQLSPLPAMAQMHPIAEMFDMLSGRDTFRYNCSSKTRAEWYETGEVRTAWALYYLVSGIFFQLIAWPILSIFHFKIPPTDAHFRVFKLMEFIGLIESTEIWGVSLFPGFMALNGGVYCTNPQLTTFFGKLTMFQWLTGSASSVFLGIHRMIDVTRKGVWLVDSNLKCFVWELVICVNSAYGCLWFDTVLFNSRFMAPLLDPMIGSDERIVYSNVFLNAHNCAVTILLVAIYTIICGIWYQRTAKISSKHLNQFQQNILLQSLGISLTYALPALSFVLVYFLTTPPKWFVLFADLCYQLSGGLPFIMYVFVNNRVKRCIKENPCRAIRNRNRIAVATVSTFVI
ncbi:unnamed protein product [Caenorhabditis sp. 36 PRJEB53466]|nr:unnamed protein product [Caenorhabditis sp. 36 PRJEB53466]